jgi:hypothetical protein
MTGQLTPRARRIGGLLLWFGALGGAVAWAIQLVAAWSISELTCAAGSSAVAGLPLQAVLGITVVVPALVTAAALAASWRTWRATATTTEDRPVARSRLIGVIGVWSNLLFLAIIVLGGIAVLVFPPCQR